MGQKYKEEAKLKADSIYQVLVEEPSKFCELEKTFSGDKPTDIGCGEYDYLQEEYIVTPIRKLMTQENMNSIMPPVETNFGYHIVIPLEKKGTLIRFKHILIAFDRGF